MVNNIKTFEERVNDLVKEGKAIPICPEQLGGLKTPRLPAEIKNECVINKNNEDVTKEFVKGANEVLNLAKELGIKKAVLQPRSPSCGCGRIFSGNFDNTLVDGNGITADLLIKNGIKVIPADEYFDE